MTNKKAAAPVDLAGVAPELRPEVCRRIAAIRDFETSPGRKNAERLAKGLGIGTAQFYNLVKAWKHLRDPQRLSGKSRPRNRLVDLDPDHAELVDEIISATPHATSDKIVRETFEKAKAREMTLPVAARVKRYVHAKRPACLPKSLADLGDLIVDHTVLEIPIDIGGSEAVRPLATMIFDIGTDTLCALKLSEHIPSAAIVADAITAASMAEARPNSEPGPRTIVIPDMAGDGWQDLRNALVRAGIKVTTYPTGSYGHGQCAEGLFGQLHNGIRLRPRLVTASPVRRLVKKSSAFSPLTLHQAEKFMHARLGVAPKTDFFATLPEDCLKTLRSKLANLSQR
ncbi:hypothetical protein ACSMXM_05025 [Pacificimonas sp. ICDLI1SI03]